MTMRITVQIDSPEPVYEQIVRQVREGVNSGALPAGAPLPPVRQLATDLQLNRNTVARAYKILEEQRVVRTAGRKGTFVDDTALEEVERLMAANAERTLRRAIGTLASDGFGREEIARIFESVLSTTAEKVEQS